MFHNREQRGLFIIIIIVVVIISIIVITTFVPEPMLKRLQAPIGAEVLQVPMEPPWTLFIYLFHDVFLSLCGSCHVILGNNKKHTDIIKGGGVVFIKDGFPYIPVTYRAAFRVWPRNFTMVKKWRQTSGALHSRKLPVSTELGKRVHLFLIYFHNHFHVMKNWRRNFFLMFLQPKRI